MKIKVIKIVEIEKSKNNINRLVVKKIGTRKGFLNNLPKRSDKKMIITEYKISFLEISLLLFKIVKIK